MSNSTQSVIAADDVLHERKITFRQGLVLLICYLAYILDGFDIVVISYTAPAISAEWNIAAQELGLVFSASLLGMTLGAMFLASLADLYGRKVVVGGMLILVGIATVAVVAASSVTELVILRFVAGLGLGSIMAALAPLAGEFSPRRYRTVILAFLVSGAAMGPIVGGMMTAPAIEAYGWQSVFVTAGVVTVLAGVLMLWLVPESVAFIIKRRPPGALDIVNRTLTYLGHNTIEQLPSINDSTSQESASLKSLMRPLRWRITLFMWGAFFFSYAANYFLVSWLPQILVQAGLSQSQGIEAVVISSVGSLIGTVIFGWLGKRWALNRIIAGGFLAGAVTFVSVGILVNSIDPDNPSMIFWVVMFFSGFCTSGAFSNLYTVAMTIYPAQIRSTGIGWATGAGRSGAVVSPAVAGMLLAAGMSLPNLLSVFAVSFLFAASCIAFIRMRELP